MATLGALQRPHTVKLHSVGDAQHMWVGALLPDRARGEQGPAGLARPASRAKWRSLGPPEPVCVSLRGS